jgi:putative ubiquitin-RnfH superfamily antitoxin RatB of RatAB toxin-antitoxin module
MDKGKPEPGRAPQDRVRVVYALPDRQEIVDVPLETAMSVERAVRRSGLLERFPEAGARPLACAIFGRAVALTHAVRAGDRIEILRPLAIDPKESRRQAAKAQRRR